MVGDGEGQEHKAKFTSLREAQSKQPFVAALQFKDPREDQEDCDLKRNQPNGKANDGSAIVFSRSCARGIPQNGIDFVIRCKICVGCYTFIMY